MAIMIKQATEPISRLKSQANRPKLDPLPLENGARLSRVEFERRYTAMPQIKKAELIEGVVFMPSPVRIEHSRSHAQMITEQACENFIPNRGIKLTLMSGHKY